MCAASICIGTGQAARQSTPEIENLTRLAEMQWKASEYKNYVTTCEKVEQLKPGFGAAYNVAAGLFMEGLMADADRKLGAMEGRYILSEDQKAKIRRLRKEIHGKDSPGSQSLQRSEVITTRGGSAILSKDFPQLENPDIDRTRTVNRSAEALGLKPQQAGRYLEHQFELGAKYYGYSWSPSPESMENR